MTTQGSSSSGSRRMLDKLRPWNLSVAGRRKSKNPLYNSSRKSETISASDPYTALAVASSSTNGHEQASSPRSGGHSVQATNGGGAMNDEERDNVENGYEWEVESEDGSDVEPDTFSWVDPSIIGSEAFRRSPERDEPTPQGSASTLLQVETAVLQFPDPPEHSRPTLNPNDSYNLLLAYQSTSFSPTTSSSTPPQRVSPHTSSDGGHLRQGQGNPEWYEMVDRAVRDSLDKREVKRQGLWWELINGEREYVRDLKVVCEDFVVPLREHQPPILEPERKLVAFIREVFSTMQGLYESHATLLERLMGRQRQEWPLLSSAADLLLETFLQNAEQYEKYMKNFPFAESRIKRERNTNPRFMGFLDERNTVELTRRRDISNLLSRPMSRLPRIMLQLKTLVEYTPVDHPDHEQIPAVLDTLQRIVRGSQPGIESAEARVKCWNVAERLLFRRGELHDLDISGNAHRELVHMGYVFRRIRSETNWHGWQDLKAVLLDNYLLLTRDEDNGKLVVISRPVHIDFLHLVSADGVPERRHDYLPRRRPNGAVPPPSNHPDRLMYPFTITGGVGTRTYTLCTGTQTAREQWKEKIEGAKTLRKFDLDSNRMMAIHTISLPSEIRHPVLAADTFVWRNRETVAVVSGKSLWIGWRRDIHSFRELVRLNVGSITAISAMPDFGWILVVHSGSLSIFNLHEMIPTSEPETWIMHSQRQAIKLSAPEHSVAFARVGTTKDRLMVVYAAHLRNSHQTILSFHEPLVEYDNGKPFRHFASTIIPGYASELSFFRQTVAVVTERSFVIAEPGNPTFNQIPTVVAGVPSTVFVSKMVAEGKPMAMYQIAENEFLLVYDVGACFVTKFGEIARSGAYIRWNLTPAYTILQHPHILLFDESGSRVEIRDLNGKMCELVEEPGLKPVIRSRAEGEVLGTCARGLVQLKETVAL